MLMLTVSLDCTFFNVPLTFLSNVYSTFCEYNLINLSDIAEIVLKVALNTIKQTNKLNLSEKKSRTKCIIIFGICPIKHAHLYYI